jgi:hypothetical protein
MIPKDERNDGSVARTGAAGPSRPHPWAFKLAAVTLVVVSALAATGLARLMRPAQDQSAPKNSETNQTSIKPQELFAGWTKPDVVILLSAQQYGYLLPCGCSRPQKGGMERRYNLVQQLRERFGNVVALDLGDVPQRQGPANLANVQGLIKYRYAMMGMREMGYSAVGLGEYEAAQPLFHTLGEWAINEVKPPRVICCNLDDDTWKDVVPLTYSLDSLKETPVKVSVTSLIGHTQRKAIAELFKNDATNRPKLGESGPALDAALKKMGKGADDLRVLMYHGYATTKIADKDPEAVTCAKAYPQFPLILALSEEDEPPVNPLSVTHRDGTKTTIVSLGHKAKFVGVVGVWRTGKASNPFELRYQLVELTEQFLTPEGKEKDNPIAQLMERYTQELKKGDYLNKYAQRTHDLQAGFAPADMPKYVGSERCGDCHVHADEVWKKSKHHQAYKTLVDAKNPSLRQFDPECIVCHTVGYAYKTGFIDAIKTPKLKDVGCESCHGPASRHVNDPNNAKWQQLLNPWKQPAKETPAQKEARLLRIDFMCQKCHDMDNDVHWMGGGFARKWPAIEHHTPKAPEN